MLPIDSISRGSLATHPPTSNSDAARNSQNTVPPERTLPAQTASLVCLADRPAGQLTPVRQARRHPEKIQDCVQRSAQCDLSDLSSGAAVPLWIRPQTCLRIRE